MSGLTEFDEGAVRDIAAHLLDTYNEHSQGFLDIRENGPGNFSPEAGAKGFPRAEWLEAVVGDRRDSFVAEGRRMQKILDGLRVTLEDVATELEHTDQTNHDAILRILNDRRDVVDGELEELAYYQEAAEGNYATPSNQEVNNDGDGYNNENGKPEENEDDEDDPDEDDEDEEDEDDETEPGGRGTK